MTLFKRISKMDIQNILKKTGASLKLGDVLCRLLAAWLCFTAAKLIGDSDFFALSYAQDSKMWLVLLWIGLAFIAFSLVKMLLVNYATDTYFLLAGTVVCASMWLTSYSNFLFSIAVIIVLSMVFAFFLHKNEDFLEGVKLNGAGVWICSLAIGLLCCFFIGAIGSYRYLTFSAPNFDFGIFVNMFHNMRTSGAPLCTCERDVLLSHFVVHLSPIYYLILPFYCIFPSPLTLQIAQAVILASGVVPVVLLCRHFKLGGKTTVAVSAIYCLYPALTTGCFYDIHENCFLTPLLLWVFYFFEKEKWVFTYLFAALTLFVKEDAAIYIIVFAVFAILSKKKPLHAFILAIMAGAYFITALTLLDKMGAHYSELYATDTPNPVIAGPMVYRFSTMIHNLDDGLFGAVKTLLLNPGYTLIQLFSTSGGGIEKLRYFIQMLLPVGFIPFFTKRASRYLLITPILLNLITDYPYQYDTGFQYHFGIAAFLVYAMIANLPEMKPTFKRNVLCVALVAGFCLYVSAVMPTFEYYHNTWKENKDTYTEMESILDTIPEDASVCCDTFLLPHIADREIIYETSFHGDVGDTDYVIFDSRYSVSKTQLYNYIDQGYYVSEVYPDMMIILEKE